MMEVIRGCSLPTHTHCNTQFYVSVLNAQDTRTVFTSIFLFMPVLAEDLFLLCEIFLKKCEQIGQW